MSTNYYIQYVYILYVIKKKKKKKVTKKGKVLVIDKANEKKLSCITSCSGSLSGKWSIHPKIKFLKNGTKVFLLLFSICKIIINSN